MSSKSSYGCLVPLYLFLGLILYSILNRSWLMLGVIVLVVFLLFLGFSILIEVFFRDKYGMGYLSELREMISFFFQRGYSLEKYFGAGSSNPGVILSKDGCSNVKIILHAPLLFGRQYIEVFEEKEPSKKWKFRESNYSDTVIIDKILGPFFGSVSAEINHKHSLKSTFWKL